MLFDNYFDEMEYLFKYLDTKKEGKIKKEVFIPFKSASSAFRS